MFKKRKTDFRANSKTKSTNKRVLEIYDIILQDEGSDTDYWYIFGEGLFDRASYKFISEDWEELKRDLSNWSSLQIEILSICLTSDYHPDYDTPTDDLSKKSEIYLFILSICGNDIFFDILDDLHFIQFNTNKDLETLIAIKNRIEGFMTPELLQNGDSWYSANRYKKFIELINVEIEEATEKSNNSTK
jgi:hypothetical protein